MKYSIHVIAIIFIFINSEIAIAFEDKVGKQCYVSYANVIVSPNKSAIEAWPDDPKVESELKGLDDIESHNGKVIFKTKYNLDELDPYWRDKDVYIVKIGKKYFLVVEEGLIKCKN